MTGDETSDERNDSMTPCEGYAWVGQSFKYCDECGQPFWEHTHERRNGPVYGEVRLVRITPDLAEQVRKKWE